MVRLGALGRKKDVREQIQPYDRTTGSRLRRRQPPKTDPSTNKIPRSDPPIKGKVSEPAVNFGGPAGAYLRSLVKISAIYSSTCLIGIEFYYNHVDILSGCQKFGKCSRKAATQTIDFDIDGPGGEVIKYIDVPQDSEPFDNSDRAFCDFKVGRKPPTPLPLQHSSLTEYGRYGRTAVDLASSRMALRTSLLRVKPLEGLMLNLRPQLGFMLVR